jgi:hypothetical protein
MDYGLSAYIGYLLSQKPGFSIVACGYVQSSMMDKFTFTNNLSFRSKAKKFLQRLSYISILHFVLIFLTIFCCITITTEKYRKDSGEVKCVVYSQDGKPSDRGWFVFFTIGRLWMFKWGSESISLDLASVFCVAKTQWTFRRLQLAPSLRMWLMKALK